MKDGERCKVVKLNPDHEEYIRTIADFKASLKDPDERVKLDTVLEVMMRLEIYNSQMSKIIFNCWKYENITYRVAVMKHHNDLIYLYH